MHQCLTVLELLHRIFRYVALNGTLAFLARTCRTFTDPALDVLYCKLDSFQPLIRCLPRDLRKEDRYSLSFQGSMSTESWDIFMGYSRRVRSLHHRCDLNKPSQILEKSLFNALSSPPTLLLFPNLQELSWDEPLADAGFIRLLLGPNLVSFKLGGFLDSSCCRQIIPSLAALCPQLQRVELGEPRAPLAYNVLVKWAHLKHLSCGEITAEAFSYLARLPSLRSLDFWLPSVASTVVDGQDTFAKLRTLKIRSETFSPSALFLPSTSRPLRKFSLHLVANNGAPSPDDIHKVFDSLSSSCTSDTLLQIRLDLSRSDVLATSELSTLSLDTFEPLFPLRNLRTLSIISGCTFSLDDDDLKRMALAWPQLEVLELGTLHGWGGRPQITLEGLPQLLRHCPSLRTLGLAIDATTVGARLDRPGHGVCNTSIKELELADSPIANPVYVAAFLSDILPSVKSLEAWGDPVDDDEGEGDKYMRRWARVEKMLDAFTNVRNQERRWLNGLGDSEGEMDDWDIKGSDSDDDESSNSSAD
ncbi:hypothetical protein BV22DRAFT_93760 [Leucogyrophana mollusca]|uniref:Uncharacterized protein n=1 Tax=Leucogyrophana mollusca TaxID=85980 RepID=A0ACB8BVI4_9AGAM|nr:hypothetical protein BV22DRAFT_93760 [Leucogyrophana mollusca]